MQTQEDRQTDTQTYIHTKPPSGQGLTLTLKGLCLAPVIATPQAGYVVSIYVSAAVCLWGCVCMRETQCMEWTPADTLSTQSWLSHGFTCTGILVCFCVNNWETTAVLPTMLTEAEQLCLLTCLFVVVGRQEMRSCWGRWLCARKAYRRAGPGQEENTNHLLASLAGLMEMRNSSFSAMYQGKAESGYTRHHQLTPALNLSPAFPLLDSNHNVRKHHWCPNILSNHLLQQNLPLSSCLRYIPSHFTQGIVCGRFIEGTEFNTTLSC